MSNLPDRVRPRPRAGVAPAAGVYLRGRCERDTTPSSRVRNGVSDLLVCICGYIALSPVLYWEP